MEFANRTTGRTQQFEELYAQLQLRYETQTIEMIEYKTKANFWEAQFKQIKTREEELIAENEELKAKLRKREQQLFGKSSEKNVKGLDKNPNSQKEQSKKKRGQQPGSQGHGRRDYSHLPTIEETIGLSEKYSRCS